MTTQKLQAGDFWGGLAATTVVLPQAMAFGVALVGLINIDPARGALAGLLSAAMLCLATGIFGGTTGLISSPTGPTLVLISGALLACKAAGIAGPDLLLAMTVIMVLTGLLQCLIGLTGGGQLIKYIPYPVISGFMTGAAILMVKSQLKPLFSGIEGGWHPWLWVPVFSALATYLAISFGPRLVQWLPGTIAGLLAGTLVFHITVAFGSAPAPAEWLIGQIPGLDSISLDYTFASLAGFPWQIIIGAALALAVLASLDTLLTSLVADVESSRRHNARWTLTGEGVGMLTAGLFGGMAGAGTTGATVIAVKTGARRWAGVITAIAIILIVVIGRDAGRILPVAVLAGVIIHVAVHMIDLDIVIWLKHRRTRMDAMIAILVTTITVIYDLMVAVGVGVAIAVILFIRNQIKAPVIHRRSTAKQVRSMLNRTRQERELLDEYGERIILYELRGNLFFATADRLLNELGADLLTPAWIILDLQRVGQVDLTAIKIIQQIAERLHQHGGELMFCNVHEGIGFGKKVQKTLKKVSTKIGDLHIHTFNGKDEALEYAENALLDQAGHERARAVDTLDLAATDLCGDMSPIDVEKLRNVLLEQDVAAGEKVFSTGDPGNQLYITLRGQVDIRLPTTRRHYKRLALCGPGSVFGELAFLIPGPRSADAIALHDTRLLALNHEGFSRLVSESPDVAVRLLLALGKPLVLHQRWSAQEIQRLSEW